MTYIHPFKYFVYPVIMNEILPINSSYYFEILMILSVIILDLSTMEKILEDMLVLYYGALYQ